MFSLKMLFVVNTRSDPISTAKRGFKVRIRSPVSARTAIPDDSPRGFIGNGGAWRVIKPDHKKTNPMSKSEEIQILTAAADQLGHDSYCGSWLREQITFIESDIRSDIAPGILASASISDCMRLCAEMRVKAIEERDKILSDARKEADLIRCQAVRFNELQRDELKRTLKAILSRID